MTTIFKKTAFLFSLVICLFSCKKEYLSGEGFVKTETRPLESFSTVEITGNRQAEVIYSLESKVELTGYENLLKAYKAEVSGGKLQFNFPDGYVVKGDNLTLKIFTPKLDAIVMSGNSKTTVSSGFSGQEMSAKISGSADLTYGLASYQNCRYEVSGSGTIWARSLTAKKGEAFVSGSGKIELQVSETLHAQISGSGTIHFWGNPGTINSKVSGSGSIVKH